MGVAGKDLKAMADDGKLTADQVSAALISQLGTLRMNMQPCLIPYHPLQPKLKTPLWPGWVTMMPAVQQKHLHEWCCE